jgi:hypothetical protein
MRRNGLFKLPTTDSTGIDTQVAGNFRFFVGFKRGSEVVRCQIPVRAGVKSVAHAGIYIRE